MRTKSLFLSLLMFSMVAPCGHAQTMRDREKEFLQSKPAIGDVMPNVTVFSPDGAPFNTAGLRGHYTVLTFGCLT